MKNYKINIKKTTAISAMTVASFFVYNEFNNFINSGSSSFDYFSSFPKEVVVNTNELITQNEPQVLLSQKNNEELIVESKYWNDIIGLSNTVLVPEVTIPEILNYQKLAVTDVKTLGEKSTNVINEPKSILPKKEETLVITSNTDNIGVSNNFGSKEMTTKVKKIKSTKLVFKNYKFDTSDYSFFNSNQLISIRVLDKYQYIFFNSLRKIIESDYIPGEEIEIETELKLFNLDNKFIDQATSKMIIRYVTIDNSQEMILFSADKISLGGLLLKPEMIRVNKEVVKKLVKLSDLKFY